MTNPDVLVVGAGPTGLTLASELQRHGVSCRLIEALAAPVTTSKAAVVHARTMEVFDDMGVVAEILERSKPVHGMNVFSAGKRVAHVVLREFDDSPYSLPHGISQHDTELALAAHLTSLGGTIERGKRLESLSVGDDGVEAKVALAGQAHETIEARWVVGCDGAHSVVRKAIGCTFEGAPYEERIVQADVRVQWPMALPDDEIATFLHEDGPLAAFPLFKDGRYRLIVVLPKGAPDEEPTLEMFQRFADHHRRTDRYRKGRAFVAGDAAHIHSPVGGQGMNTGIQDAYNLAWKLALVTRGAARESLLDSYEAERQPVAKALLATTDAAMRGLEVAIGLRSPIGTALRNQLISLVTSTSLVRARATRTVSMLDIAYPDSPIVKQDRIPVWQANLTSSAGTEHPGLADWAAFGDAPAPGHRAVDAPLEPAVPGRTHVLDLLRGTRHVLFLFDGAAPTTEGYRNLEAIGAQVRERFGSWVDVHVVVPRAERPAQAELRWDHSLVLDAAGAFHRRYGARSECLYLVRPDGYVAYRCQPASADRLLAYLGTIFA
jgi:2-polyprenyl-6-methoxyphenol hydroxylase-like FAD-dependent oxidoreductase